MVVQVPTLLGFLPIVFVADTWRQHLGNSSLVNGDSLDAGRWNGSRAIPPLARLQGLAVVGSRFRKSLLELIWLRCWTAPGSSYLSSWFCFTKMATNRSKGEDDLWL